MSLVNPVQDPSSRRALGAPSAALAVLVGLVAVLTVLPAGASHAAAPAAPSGSPAWVRGAHLVPDLGKMDIDLIPIGTSAPADTVKGASYGDVSTYNKVPAGSYSVVVHAPGSPVTDAAATGVLQAQAGAAYTVAALGTSAKPTLVPLTDDLTQPPAGQVRVRVLSAASSASAVDVSAASGPVVTQNAPFGAGTGYVDVPAGRWVLTAAPTAGSGSSATPGTTTVTLSAGSTYTLAVTDSSGGALAITPLADAKGSARTPVGGAQTGAGGTARAVVVDRTVLGAARGAVVALAAAALLLVAGATRRRGVAGRSHSGRRPLSWR